MLNITKRSDWKTCERYQNLFWRRKRKSENMDVNDTKVFLNMKSKVLISSIAKYFWKSGKTLHDIRNFFNAIGCCINIFFIICKIYVDASKRMQIHILLHFNPVDTGHKLSVHKTSSERLMYVQFTSSCLWGSSY